MLERRLDYKVGAELVPGSRDKKYALIDERLLDKNLLVRYRGDIYVFLFASNYWSSLNSEEALVQLNSVTGIENVTVGYSVSTKPYISYMERRAKGVSVIPLPVCFGTRRLGIRREGDTLYLKEIEDVVDIPEDSGVDKTVSSFCTLSCSLDSYPLLWKREGMTKMGAFLRPIFKTEMDMTTFKWTIGSSVLDPVHHSKFCIFHGRGGSGKSTLLNSIEAVFRGCYGTISSGLFTSKLSDPPVDAATEVTTKRIVTCGELDLKTKSLNIHLVKLLTGGDRITVPPVRLTTKSTVVCASNYLPTLEGESEWYTTQVQRRFIVQPLNTSAMDLPVSEVPDADEDIQDFILECVYVRLLHHNMPVSVDTLLLTLLGGSYYEVADIVTEDSEATVQNVLDASYKIELILNLESESLGAMAKCVTPESVFSVGGVLFIKRLRLK